MFRVFGIPEQKQATVLLTSLLLSLTSADTDCYGGHLHRVHHPALHLHRCHPLGHHLRHSSEILPENRTAAQATGGWRWGHQREHVIYGGHMTHLLYLTTQEQVLRRTKVNDPSESPMEAREETSLWGRCHSNHNSTDRDGDGSGPRGQRSPQRTKTWWREGLTEWVVATERWNHLH